MNDSSQNRNSRTWVVVPALNEAGRIGAVVRSLVALGLNVVVVDDGSADDTLQVAIDNGATALRHVINRGQGAALQTGLEYVVGKNAEVVVTFDADGQHDAKDIAALTAPILEREADVVLGSRFLSESGAVGLPVLRRWILKAGVVFTRVTTGLQLTDTHNGIRAFSFDAARKIRIEEDRMSHASDLLQQIASLNLRFKESPVSVHYTADSLAKGQSNSAAFGIFARLIFSKLMQ